MLIDKNNKYVKANAKWRNGKYIEVELNKGKYYLISDINFRYIQGQKPYCYNLSCYSSSPVDIYEENNKYIKHHSVKVYLIILKKISKDMNIKKV